MNPPQDHSGRLARLNQQGQLDSEAEDDEAFLRAQKRVPIRRRRLPSSRAGRSVFAVAIVIAAAGAFVLAVSALNSLRSDPLFSIASSSSIQTAGNHVVTRAELLNVFGSDIGRSIFSVPLSRRQAEIERIPWVASAVVMRLFPDKLRVVISERVPIAFVRLGSTIELIDAQGVLLRMRPAAIAQNHYSFPVISGIRRQDSPAMRAAKISIYQNFMAALDAGGSGAKQMISEVNLSDPEDIRVLIPEHGSDILAHFGDSDYLARFQRFEQHIAEWQQQYPRLASVDLRYPSQVVLDMAPATAEAVAGPSAPKSAGGIARKGALKHRARRQR